MKIVINALSARMGGGQTYIINLLRYLPIDKYIEIYIYAPKTLQIPADKRITRLFTKWPTANPMTRAIWEKFMLPLTLKKMHAEILFCPGGVVGAVAPQGCKTVTMFRNMIPFDIVQRRKYPIGYQRLRNWILHRLMLQSMTQADLVIFISEYARKVIENVVVTPLKKLVVIPHGVHPHFRIANDTQLVRPEWLPEEYLLYVSTIDVYKAQVEVVQAYAKLKLRRETKEKLILAGPENIDYGLKVRDEIGRLGLVGDVVLVGAIPYEQLPAVYHHAKINIYASESENCPNILLEALAAGRPIVSSNRPPMPEFAGEAAIYFNPSSPDELTEKLASIIDNPKWMAILANNASERSMLFDWSTSARLTWDALENLCPKKKKVNS